MWYLFAEFVRRIILVVTTSALFEAPGLKYTRNKFEFATLKIK